MDIEQASEVATIQRSRDLFAKEDYAERLDKRLDKLISRLINKKDVDPEKIKKVTQEYIDSIRVILEKLEQEKRRVLASSEEKLQEITQLLELEARLKLSSKEIKDRLIDLKNTIDHVVGQVQRGEIRGTRCRSPIGYYVRKLSGKKRILSDAARKLSRELPLRKKEKDIFQALKAELEQAAPQQRELDPTIKKQILVLIRIYKLDMESVLAIEVDFQIEEAERLHKISQYMHFFQSLASLSQVRGIAIYFVKQLKELRDRALIWVYQDEVQSIKFDRYRERLKKLVIEATAKDFDLSEIEVIRDVQQYGVKGQIYKKMAQKKFTKGVVALHGIGGNRHQLGIFARRLANIGYLVYTFDLPGHALDTQEYSMALTAEYIQRAVRFLRTVGCEKVAVVGHSVGASAAALAALHYGVRLEQSIYVLMDRYLYALSRLRSGNIGEWGAIADDAYSRIQDLITSRSARLASTRRLADLYVFAAPPKNIGTTMPRRMINLIRNLPEEFMKKYVIGYDLVDRNTQTNRLKIRDREEFFDFFISMKGPVDYIDLLIQFSKRNKVIKDALAKVFGPVPKLLLIAGLDYLVWNWRPSTKRKYIDLFSNLRKLEVKKFFLSDHLFSGLYGPKYNIQGLLQPKASGAIMEFIEKNL